MQDLMPMEFWNADIYVISTVITTTTTFTPYFQTTTALSYITTTTITAGAPQKRDAAPEPTPAPSREQLYMVAPLLQQCDESEANKSVISSVSSACSCLFILPRTVDVSVVTTVVSIMFGPHTLAKAPRLGHEVP